MRKKLEREEMKKEESEETDLTTYSNQIGND